MTRWRNNVQWRSFPGGTAVATQAAVITRRSRGPLPALRFSVIAVAVVSALVRGDMVMASSAATPLGVSVTVVRSCSVQARPVDAASAAVRLACSSGHVSRVRLGGGGLEQLAAPDNLFHVTPIQESSAAPDVRVVTVNF